MKSLLIGVLIFLAGFHQASAEETITWQIIHWPPWMILEGEDAGKGRFNYILKIAQKNLPQYKHVTENMNWARFWHDIENNKNVCNIFAYKTEKRDEIAYFSEPHSFVLPNAIIMKKSMLEKLGNPDTYSIVTLLQDKRFHGYIETTRSYTETLDAILATHESGSNVTRVAESAESLLKMVSTGRIDYTIEYPLVAAYFEQKNDNPDSISSIPITEVEPFAYVYMACTKNEWGKKVVEQWNQVLRRIKPTPEFRKLTERGHTDEREIRLIRQYYETFLNAR